MVPFSRFYNDISDGSFHPLQILLCGVKTFFLRVMLSFFRLHQMEMTLPEIPKPFLVLQR